MVTVGHLLSPSESKAQTSCLVLRAMNKCHWEHAWEGRGWGTPGRSSADSFSFQTICRRHGIEDRDSKRPLVVTMKILIRAEALMGFIREGDVSLEDVLSHLWVDKMLHMPDETTPVYSCSTSVWFSSLGHKLGTKSPPLLSGQTWLPSRVVVSPDKRTAGWEHSWKDTNLLQG